MNTGSMNSEQKKLFAQMQCAEKNFKDYLLGEIAAMEHRDRNVPAGIPPHSVAWVNGYDGMMGAIEEMDQMLKEAGDETPGNVSRGT